MPEQQIQVDRLLADASAQTAYGATIRFKDSQIVSIEVGDRPTTRGPGATDILAIPPLSNAHDHGRGLRPIAYGAQDHALEAWVPATYTLPRIDPYVIAASAFASMARSGIAAIVHCHLSRGKEALIEEARAVSRAARDVGVRVAFVAPMRDRHRLGYAPDEEVLAYVPERDRAAIAERWLKPIPPIEEQLAAVSELAELCENDLFQVQFGPVGVEWCSDTMLSRVAEASAASGRRVHMHLLESKYQRQWADRRLPHGIVRHLENLGLLSPRLTVAHGTWLRPDECQLLAQHGVTVSVNTSSNLRLRSGVAPVPHMQRAGIRFALGLDALALDDDDDLLRETRLAYLLHCGTGFDEELTRADMLLAASHVGASVISGCAHLGTIREGGPADLLLLDFDAMAGDLCDGLYDELQILHARGRAAHVHGLYVAGRKIVADGRALGVDEPAIQAQLRTELEQAAPELRELRPLLGRYQAALGRFYQEGGHLK